MGCCCPLSSCSRKQVSVKPFRDPRTLVVMDIVFDGEHSGVIRFEVSSVIREVIPISKDERR